VTPRWHAHQHGHVDERCKAHGEGGHEQTLMRMTKHGREDLRIENVAQARYQGEEEEKSEVEDEENDGDDLEPVYIVGKLVEQDRYDSSAHRDDEPAVPDWVVSHSAYKLSGQR
jgi:hypothetical protein